MHVLTASTLLLLAASPVAATELQWIAPAPSHILTISAKPQAAPYPLMKPTSELADETFVPQKPAAAADTETAAAVAPIDDQTICQHLATAASTNGLPITFFARLIAQESGFDPLAVSRAGAQGVAQFMPEVAIEKGLADPFDPAQALPISARFLRALRDQFGNLGLAAAAYNAGAKRVQDWLDRGRRLPKETRDYVRNITGRALELWVKDGPKDLGLKPPATLPCRMPETVVATADTPATAPVPPTAPSDASAVKKLSPASLAKAEVRQDVRPADKIAHAEKPAHGHRVAQAPHAGHGAHIVRLAAADAKHTDAKKATAHPHQQHAIILVNRHGGRSAVRMAEHHETPKVARTAERHENPKAIRLALATRPARR